MAIMSAFFGAIADVLPKPILDEHVVKSTFNPFSITALMFLVSAILFTFLIKIISKSKKLSKYKQISFSKIGKNDKIMLLTVSIIEAIATTTFYFGLEKTSATNGAILGNMDIVFTMLIAFIFLKEKLRRYEIFPFLLIIVGSVLVPVFIDTSMHDSSHSSIAGDFLVILSCFFYGIEMLLFKKVGENIGSLRMMEITSYITGITALAAALFFGGIYLGFEETLLEEIPTVLFTGIFGVGISILFLVAAIKIIGPTRSIILFSTTTIFGVMLSYFILSESIRELHVAAVGFIIFGTYFLRGKMAAF
ncbi:DMT family transporter [Candidatus Nitrosotenuis chungbukensis]|uniref:DMT family transporter n=1 Tax=Candidatus Nitrosotenuis chungbukensis TaxID=1353246 RepID=UPI0005B2DCE3|nr:DMT family transporter [Candidatus Nitrosotenuis chungbukensis]WKT57934.1 DMT family transporter [Candidatus Nitrosotenuis chungbukensis]